MEKRKHNIRSIIIWVSLVALVAAITEALIVQAFNDKSTTNILASVVLCILFTSLVYIFLICIKTIGSNEIALVSFFGRPLFQTTSPGAIIVIPPYELTLMPSTPIELFFPEDKYVEVITREKKVEKIEHINKPEPIRIIHGESTTPSKNPLDTRLTTSVRLILTYKIVDLITFMKLVGTLKKAKTQIRDKMVNIVAIECSKFSLATNLIRRSEINSILKEEIHEFTKDWGITIVVAQLQEIDLANEINLAQNLRSVSEIHVPINQNNAEKIAFDGIAQAKVSQAFLFAKGAGLKKLAEELKIEDKKLIIEINALENIFRNSKADLNMFGADSMQLFNMIMTNFTAGNNKTPLN